MQYQRKLIQIFKSFIEKALVPQIKRMEGSLFQWNKFNTMISNENINYNQLQNYVDSLGPLPTSPISFQRKDNTLKFNKKRQDDQLTPTVGSTFNPSKTFGGDRARIMFPLKGQGQQSGNNNKQWSFSSMANKNKDDLYNKSPSNNGTTVNIQSFLPGLERLTKIFAQNHSKLQSVLEGVVSTNSAPFTSEFAVNRPNY